MTSYSPATSVFKRVLALVLALLLGFQGSVLCASEALAYVDDTDIVAGVEMAERDLTTAQQIDIDATYACMIDDDGLIYYERNAHVAVKIGSITKIMTAIIALENSSSTDVVTVSERAATVGESTANLREGDQLTMFDMLCCLLIPSGNDAAMAIAEYIGEKALATGMDLGLEEGEETPTDPLDAFVCLMNKKAEEMGLEDTLFTNPHGLDTGDWEGDQHSSAYDVCLMAKYAMQFDDFTRIVASTGATVDVVRDGEVRQLTLTTTNWFLSSYAYANGVKTGYTEMAGYCFVGSSVYSGVELYASVLQCEDENSRFEDVLTLHRWGFLHRVSFTPVNSEETVTVEIDGESTEVALFAEVAHPGWIDKTFATYMDASSDEELILFDIDGNVTQRVTWNDLSGDIKAGDVVGTVEYLQHNEVIATYDILAAEDCAAPNMFQSVQVWFQRLKAKFTGDDTVALTTIYNTVERINDKTLAS